MTDSLIRDKVITAIGDKNLLTLLFDADNLDLVKLITICHEYNANRMQTEKADAKNLNEKIIQQKQQTKKYRETNNIGINDKLKTDENDQKAIPPRFGHHYSKPCWKCNTFHPVQCCPIREHACMICGDKNHYTYCCRSLKQWRK